MIWCVTLNPSLDVSFVTPDPWQPGTIGQAARMDVRLGGKGNNVARTIKALGGTVSAVSILGGIMGRDLEARAAALAIPVVAEWVSEDSRCCITVVAPDHVTELRAPGPRVPQAVLDRLRDRLSTLCQPDDWVTLSGSLPPGADPATYGDWIRALKPRVRGILVDTSGPALAASLAAEPTAICPNAEEWTVVASDGIPDRTQVFITRGRQGVEWRAPGKSARRWRPPEVAAINTVGAGDSFLGAVVWSLDRGDDWETAIRWGVAVSAASVETVGVAAFDVERARALWPEVLEVSE
ncbi:MAG: PfkB family carbohydrate kinase [Firmicutes bacterium]|nr:PfkB family carbohydrate kinase [Bacillota bacterium]